MKRFALAWRPRSRPIALAGPEHCVRPQLQDAEMRNSEGLMETILFTYAMNTIFALAILVVGWGVASWARKLARRGLGRSERIDPTLVPIIASTLYYAIIILVVIAVLAQFGIQTASILAVIGTAGLAVGLALQGTLSNVASGMMLLFLRPFGVGDYIDSNGVAGTVLEIGLFATQLETFDGIFIMIPNSQLFGSAIRNYSRLPYRRVDVPVGISYGDDVEKALSVALSLISEDTRVISERPPQVMVTGLGDSSVDLNLRCWTERANYWDLLFDLQKKIKIRLDAEGISIPFPQRDVHLIENN
jgi:small conductance mechanosensitive channel